MNITAIIAEYNPLHNGHIYHIEATKKSTNCDGIICLMSGNFAQRGIPSIIDKWSKTKIALKSGIDLVIELPVIYSISSAEFFAFGAISLLNSLGVINNLSFGSESGNIDNIYKISEILCNEPEEYKYFLKSYLNKGFSYPQSRSKALNCIMENKDINHDLNLPNNILAIEYCKSLIKLNSPIVPYTITRVGSLYNEKNLNNKFSSATSIRNYLKTKKDICFLKNFLPNCSFDTICNYFKKNLLVFEEDIFKYIKYKSLSSYNSIKNIPDASEGLHNKIYKSLHTCNCYNDLINGIKSKRYTETRIKRILCQYFIGFDEFNTLDLRKSPASYGKILGFNEKGKKILKEIKNKTNIPLYTKLPKKLNESINLDIRSTMAYSVLNKSIDSKADFINSPIIY